MKRQIKVMGILAVCLLAVDLNACSFRAHLVQSAGDTEPVTESQGRQQISPKLISSEDSTEQETASEGVSEQVDEVRKMDSEYQIEGFEIILQMPELPTGCEITALTMVLNFYGLEADKMEMAMEYMPSVPAELYEGDDGRLYGPDLNQYFIGDPRDQGYVCGTGAIATAANDYLVTHDSLLRAVDKTGTEPEELYGLVNNDIPVVVWVTIDMEERNTPEGWNTEDGTYVDWSTNDHGAVLIGYTPDTVTIADPISGLVEYEKEVFEEVFLSRGNQCVILEEEQLTSSDLENSEEALNEVNR